MKITKEDFQAWQAHPVTEQFFAAIRAVAEKAQSDWNAVSWGNDAMWMNGQAEQMRIACRTRAECAEDILAISFEEEDSGNDA